MARRLRDLVRIATLLETEGYIGIEKRLPRKQYKSPSYIGKVTVEMADREYVDLLHAMFKGSTHTRKRRGCKTLYSCHITSRQAETLLRAVTPFLISTRKIQAAKQVLALFRLSWKHLGRGIKTPKTELLARERYYQRCRKLNKRGG